MIYICTSSQRSVDKFIVLCSSNNFCSRMPLYIHVHSFGCVGVCECVRYLEYFCERYFVRPNDLGYIIKSIVKLKHSVQLEL